MIQTTSWPTSKTSEAAAKLPVEMRGQRAHRGQAPRDTLLHPIWEPVSRGNPDEAMFLARCLLGSGVVGATRRLSMVDLRAYAALGGLLREQTPVSSADDPALGHRDARTVETTGYQLLERVAGYGKGGDHLKRLRHSLIRLADVRVCVRTINADPDLAVQQVREGYVSLLGDIWVASTQLELSTPQQWGQLRGATSLKVEVGYWTAQQIISGQGTWLDLDLLRALGPGLPARVWAALEGWARWPQRSLDGCEEAAIGLGRPALESLGVGNYPRPYDARRALDRAGARITAVDLAYELVRCEKRAGWCLIIRRRVGARARSELRRQARVTSAEGAAVRTAARQSLAQATSA